MFRNYQKDSTIRLQTISFLFLNIPPVEGHARLKTSGAGVYLGPETVKKLLGMRSPSPGRGPGLWGARVENGHDVGCLGTEVRSPQKAAGLRRTPQAFWRP
eukprot:9486074-Pyramimonas_sp.AAC.1